MNLRPSSGYQLAVEVEGKLVDGEFKGVDTSMGKSSGTTSWNEDGIEGVEG